MDDERTCYSGSENTDRIGICTRGTQLCSSQGIWGQCAGEQLPLVEDCSDQNRDENCDGFECGIWTFNLDGFGKDVVETEDGGAFLLAELTKDTTINGVLYPFQGGYMDAVMVRLSAEGVPTWAFPIASSSDDAGYRLRYRATSQTLVALTFVGAGDFGGGAIPAGNALFALTSAGTLKWSTPITNAVDVRDMAQDSSGNVFVVGVASGTVTIGSSTISPDDEDVLVIKVSPSGAILWAKVYGGPGPQEAYGIDIDSTDTLYLTGIVMADSNFGGGTSSPSAMDAFVLKLDNEGKWINDHLIGGPGNDWGERIVVDPSGGAWVMGPYSPPFPGISASETGTFVTRIVLSGTLHTQWTAGLPAIHGNALVGDQFGGASVVGYTTRSTEVGGAAVESGVGVVATVGSSGEYKWHRTIGGPTGRIRGVGITSDDERLLIGETATPNFDLGSGPTSAGVDRFYVAKMGR
ncbi:MAG: hypothetical protein H6716_17410 [Polyangiaceae bacterium]|nr:hypothetical protein [Polyangiaceae bacterium]